MAYHDPNTSLRNPLHLPFSAEFSWSTYRPARGSVVTLFPNNRNISADVAYRRAFQRGALERILRSAVGSVRVGDPILELTVMSCQNSEIQRKIVCFNSTFPNFTLPGFFFNIGKYCIVGRNRYNLINSLPK